jgi:hypothetical protein
MLQTMAALLEKLCAGTNDVFESDNIVVDEYIK